MMRITIDNISTDVREGTTVLEAAVSLGIVIPSMCYKPGHTNHPSCMVCLVMEEDSGKFFPSCAMPAADGMRIITQSEEVKTARREALELLLSDHVGDCEAPCRLSCPAFMNIPLMNRLITNGDFSKALKVVREHIALPLILGHICPAPCEKACHRGSLDAPVSICLLKRSAANYGESFSTPLPVEARLLDESGESGESGKSVDLRLRCKKVAIIGTGPAGLSAAFYLLRSGHEVILFDKNEKPGGAMRYLIPEEQLPEEVLDADISFIQKMGALFKMDTLVTKEIFENEIFVNFDAVILATGNKENQPVDIFMGDNEDPEKFIDHKKLTTSRPGVFACGNIIWQQKMAVRSAAQGRMAANDVNHYFETKPYGEKRIKFNSHIGRLERSEVEEYLKESIPDNRVEPAKGFAGGFTPEEAIKEAKRCLHCDCRKPSTCKLRLYSEEYRADRRRFATGERKLLVKSVQHEFVIYEPEKCIKCGLCIEISGKEEHALGLTFIGRGFDVRVSVPFSQSVKEALINTAEECVSACPTGALAFKETEERFCDE